MSDFIFNGVSAANMGLRIERYPDIPKPRKRMTEHTVAGRNGVLHQSDGTLEPVTLRYEVWWKNQNSNFSTARSAHEIAQWLYTAPAGARLEDTYDDAVYRLATFQGPVNIENILGRFGRLTLEFVCQPECYLKSAEISLTFTGSGLLNNPTPFATKPLIRVTGSVSGVVAIGSKSMTVLFQGYSDERTLWCDCENQEAWEEIDGVEVSRNEWITSGDFPTIEPGRNDVRITGGITSVTIWTRAYTT